ncbi:MAG: CPBP family intramembrane metalloprotease [Anaerolineales bacterium]|nr:CPBP family intramembrane metalloprotease [Anaerolineales bacterium]
MEIVSTEQRTETNEFTYYQLSHLGKNDWWRYLLSFFFIIFCWLGFSLLLGIFFNVLSLVNNHSTSGAYADSSQLFGGNTLITLAFSLISFIPLLISLLIAVKFINRRQITSLFTPHKPIDWKRIAIGFISMVGLVIFACVFEAILYPGRYQFTFDTAEYFKYVPLIVIFVPFQAATEELVFRGYVIQSLNHLIKRPWIAILLSSTVFMLLHYSNPEVAVDTALILAYYFVVGVFMALITIKDNRLELAIGCHIGVNMFVLIANYTDSALPVPSIFTVTTLDPVYNLISFIVIAAIFYIFLHFDKRQDSFTH